MRIAFAGTMLAAITGTLLLLGAKHDRSIPELGVPPFDGLDILLDAVTASEIASFLALVDSQSGYQVKSRATHGDEANPVHAAMAYAASPVSQDSATAAAGVILSG